VVKKLKITGINLLYMRHAKATFIYLQQNYINNTTTKTFLKTVLGHALYKYIHFV